MKTITAETKEAIALAAEQVRELVQQKPDAVLALAAGRTMAALYARLGRLCAEGSLSLKDCRLFAVTEFVGGREELSCRRMLEDGLISATDLCSENCFFLDEESLADYDARISEAGGIDLAVLGLGINAHIGYNEPATPFDTLTHRQKLTDATKRQNAALFGSEAEVPDYALTMGIKTLVSAGEIILLAFGEEKAEAAFKMLYGRNDSSVPAAFLQIPSRVTVYLDRAAAAKL